MPIVLQIRKPGRNGFRKDPDVREIRIDVEFNDEFFNIPRFGSVSISNIDYNAESQRTQRFAEKSRNSESPLRFFATSASLR